MKKTAKHGIKKMSDAIALLSLELLVVFIVFFVCIAVLIILIREVFAPTQPVFDQQAFDYLSGYITNANTKIMECFTVLGSHKFLIPAFLIFFAWYYFIRRNSWYFIKIVTIAVCNLLLLFWLKFFFNRPRPLIPLLKEVPGLSFPSGHAFMGLTFFGLIIYIVYREVSNKWIKWITILALVFIILMVGLSRVYLRVHYASDVVAGYCFGIISLVILLTMLKQIEKYNAKRLPGELNVSKSENQPKSSSHKGKA